MRRSQTRGGEGLSDYRISEILGPKFEDFVNKLKATGYSSFLTNEKDKTLSYDFTEYIIAVAAAFAQIENPNIARSKETGQYGQAFEDIFKGLLSGTQTNLKTLSSVDREALKFDQLPYEHSFLKGKLLVPGFNLLSYDAATPYSAKIYPRFNTGSNNALINALLYIYYFIAQLKTDNLSGEEVIKLLQLDNLTYNNYVLKIAEILLSDKYYTERPEFPAGANIISSINRGLAAAAEIMIRDLNNDKRTSPALDMAIKDATGTVTGDLADKFKDFGSGTTALDFSKSGDVKKYLTGLGIAPGNAPGQIDTIYNALVSLTTVHKTGDDVAKTPLTPEDLENKLYNSLFNPHYLNDTFIDENPACADLTKLGKSGAAAPKAGPPGKKIPKKKGGYGGDYRYQYGGKGSAMSLRFLYDPEGADDTGNCTITTETKHYNIPKTDFANKAVITNLRGVIPTLMNVTTAGGTDEYKNNVRIIILTILHYILMTGTKLIDFKDPDITELTRRIEQALINYRTLNARLMNAPTKNFDRRFNRLPEAFAAEFSRTAYENIKYTKEGKYEALTEGREEPEKNKLSTAEIKEFYENYVLKNIKFYKTYFNMVEVATNKGFELDDPRVAGIKGADLDKYRLNVKTLKGYARLGTMTGGQVGGQWGRIVFAGQLPSLTGEGIIAIYVARDRLVSLVGQPDDVISRIVDQVYENAASGVTTFPITVGGETIPISILPIAAAAAIKPAFSQPYGTYMKKLLTDVIKNASGVSTPTVQLKINEFDLNEHSLRQTSQWVRDEADADGNSNTFVRFDKDGKVIEEIPKESYACEFFEDSVDTCVNFFTSCMAAEGGQLSDECLRLIEFKFKVNLPAKTVTEKVAKMNPAAAFQILQQFGFGSYLADSDNDPIYGIRRYKVQSVGSWLQDLFAGDTVDRCKRVIKPIIEPCSLHAWLGPDKTKILIDLFNSRTADGSSAGQGFYSYLEVLVNWVNANPQVLNPEEVKNPSHALGKYPEPNKSFDLYRHVNPYKTAHLRLREFSCGLERLKGSIMNELVGSNAPAMISTMSSIPLGIEMPFSRPGFVSPLPFNNFIPMVGGGNGYYIYEQQLKDNSFQYGYSLFDAIYKDLLGTMSSMTDNKKLRLSGGTQDKIKKKLENFKQVEDELIKLMRMAIEQNKLTQASHGYIDGFITDDRAKLNALLSKHSNLLNVSSAYNKKAINLIDLFQAIAKAVLGKLDTNEATGPSYQRPMSTQLRSQFDGKKI